MSDLKSERRSVSELSSADALDLVLDIRARRRDGIIAAAQNRKAASKPARAVKTVGTAIDKMTDEQMEAMIAKLERDGE